MDAYNDERIIQAFYQEIAPYVNPKEFMDVLKMCDAVVTGSTILKCIMLANRMELTGNWDTADIDIFIKIHPLQGPILIDGKVVNHDKFGDLDEKYLIMANFLKKNEFVYSSDINRQGAQNYPMYKRFNIQYIQNFNKIGKSFQLIYVSSSINSYKKDDVHKVIKGFDFDIVKNALYYFSTNFISGSTKSSNGRALSLKITNLQSILTKSCPFNIGDSKRLGGNLDRKNRYENRGFTIDMEAFRDKFLNEYIQSEYCPFLVHYIQFPQFSPNVLGEVFDWKIESGLTCQCDAKKYSNLDQQIDHVSEIENLVATSTPVANISQYICFFKIYNIKHVHCYMKSPNYKEIIVLEDVPTKGALLF